MELATLRALVEDGKTQREIAVHENTSQANVRYWLRKFDLKTHHGPAPRSRELTVGPRRCSCGETDPRNFYPRMWSTCRRCHNSRGMEKSRTNRKFALNFLGGKCSRCPMNISAALDIHHKDPRMKDANFRTHRNWCRSRLIRELETCEILCRNCHAIEHHMQRAKTEQKMLDAPAFAA
jgi:hypothetical protein